MRILVNLHAWANLRTDETCVISGAGRRLCTPSVYTGIGNYLAVFLIIQSENRIQG